MRWMPMVLAGILYSAAGPMAWAQPEAEKTMAKLEQATFAGGCFWCMVTPFKHLQGVSAVVSGYTGGTKTNPTYEEVSSGMTGHAEAVQVTFDPAQVTYEQLLEIFWRNIDPTDSQGQFADQGTQYRTAIFYHSEEQRRLAEASKITLAQPGTFTKPIVTQVVAASTFYPAEEYHQDFYKKNALRYNLYRAGSGREGFLKKTWGVQK